MLVCLSVCRSIGCLLQTAVADWMRSNRLQLNASKTEVLWCASARRQSQLPSNPLAVGSDLVSPVSCVRDPDDAYPSHSDVFDVFGCPSRQLIKVNSSFIIIIIIISDRCIGCAGATQDSHQASQQAQQSLVI